jgi:hypothetical protein
LAYDEKMKFKKYNIFTNKIYSFVFTGFQKNKYSTYCSGNRNLWENRDVTYNGFWENYTARSEVAAKEVSEKVYFTEYY